MTRAKFTPAQQHAYDLGYGQAFEDRKAYRAILIEVRDFFKGKVNQPTDLLSKLETVLERTKSETTAAQ